MKKQQTRLLLAAAMCAAALLAMVMSLTYGTRQEQAEFVPPGFDSAAVAGVPEVPGELGWGELDAQVYKVAVCGMLRTEGFSAEIWLTNPQSNDVWLKLRVLDTEGTVLGETGLVKPGEYLRSVRLASDLPSGMEVVLKIMAYEPETYHSAGSISLHTSVG